MVKKTYSCNIEGCGAILSSKQSYYNHRVYKHNQMSAKMKIHVGKDTKKRVADMKSSIETYLLMSNDVVTSEGARKAVKNLMLKDDYFREHVEEFKDYFDKADAENVTVLKALSDDVENYKNDFLE
jgi:hypothetical protein